MSDFMALAMYHQNEHEMEIALERRRLQREAMAAGKPARKAPGRRRHLWGWAFHTGKAVRRSVQTG